MSLRGAREGEEAISSRSDVIATLSYGTIEMTTVNQWILTRLQQTIQNVQKSLEEFRFGEAAQNIYKFVWHEFCDWYLEFLKPVFYVNDEQSKKESAQVLVHVLESILKLLHPFAPHISEELWSYLPHHKKPLIISEFPKFNKKLVFKKSLQDMDYLQKAILNVRNIRGENNISPSTKLNIVVCSPEKKMKLLKKNLKELEFVARIASTQFEKNLEFKKNGLYAEGHFLDTDIFVSLHGLVNADEEKNRLSKMIEKIDVQLRDIQGRLANENFVAKAPPHVVTDHKNKAEEFKKQKEKLTMALKKLN